jgi:hypothetical protein
VTEEDASTVGQRNRKDFTIARSALIDKLIRSADPAE